MEMVAGMPSRLMWGGAVVSPAPSLSSAPTGDTPSALHQERVVIVTRHGIRVPFPPVEGEPLVFFPLERRRLMAESANTLGLVGAAAVGLEGAEAAALVVKTCEILHPLIVMLEDPGSPYANFMYGTTVQTNAAQVG